MYLKFAARLCVSCQSRDADGDRADIWIGMPGLIQGIKNDFSSEHEAGTKGEKFHVEAMNMVTEIDGLCDECEMNEPLIKLRIQRWLNEFDESFGKPSERISEKYVPNGKLLIVGKFQKKDKKS